jgi:hypothetical protein
MAESTQDFSEQGTWEALRALNIQLGRRLHPAYRYSDWDAFCKAGKPWHNHGDSSFMDLPHGDTWRGQEALQERMRRLPSEAHTRAEACARLGIPPYVKPPVEVLGEPAQNELIPAAARLQMLADSQGGLGATGFTPSSPDGQIRAHLEGIARNGFKPPPSITTC